MKWYVYELEPIDIGWDYLQPVQHVIETLAKSEEKHFTLMLLLQQWEEAKSVAIKAGWEEIFREDTPPCVLGLPTENAQFDLAFVFKQENNGTTFVISPHQLPWLTEAKYLTA